MLDEPRLEVRPNDAALRLSSGLGDRSCMALAIAERLPAIATDREWRDLDIPGLAVILARG